MHPILTPFKNPSSRSNRLHSSKDFQLNTVPEDVTHFVQSHLQSLQELRGQFDSVFALEKMLGSNGRYIWETWAQDEIQRRLRMAQDGLNLFRSLAQQNGIDPLSTPSEVNPPSLTVNKPRRNLTLSHEPTAGNGLIRYDLRPGRPQSVRGYFSQINWDMPDKPVSNVSVRLTPSGALRFSFCGLEHQRMMRLRKSCFSCLKFW
jgi:hypothetical protein